MIGIVKSLYMEETMAEINLSTILNKRNFVF